MTRPYKAGDKVFCTIGVLDVRVVRIIAILKKGCVVEFDDTQMWVDDNQLFLELHNARIASVPSETKLYYYPSYAMGAMVESEAGICERKFLFAPNMVKELMIVELTNGNRVDARGLFVSKFEATQSYCHCNKDTPTAYFNYETVLLAKSKGQHVQGIDFRSRQFGISAKLILN